MLILFQLVYQNSTRCPFDGRHIVLIICMDFDSSLTDQRIDYSPFSYLIKFYSTSSPEDMNQLLHFYIF